MVNQEVGIAGIAMQDTEYPPITDYLLTSRWNKQLHFQRGLILKALARSMPV